MAKTLEPRWEEGFDFPCPSLEACAQLPMRIDVYDRDEPLVGIGSRSKSNRGKHSATAHHITSNKRRRHGRAAGRSCLLRRPQRRPLR